MKKKTLVIVGGGFAGSVIARNLQNSCNTILIDEKSFFEYTPSILRSIVEPSHLCKIQVKHKNYLKNTKIIKGRVGVISKKDVTVNDNKIKYDYLVIASGSSYSSPIKEHHLIDSSNAKLLRDNYSNLCKAQRVLIVGGGLVGVELAAEISEKYHSDIKNGKKQVDLIHSHERLIPRENKKASYYAEYYLKNHGVNIVLNTKVDEKRIKEYDIAFLCVGIKPNSTFMEKNFEKSVDEKGFIKTNKYLQLNNYSNIFVAGDVSNIKEEKLAQNAEKHAKIISENIRILESIDSHNKLTEYSKTEKLKVMSLGKHSGVATYKKLTLIGFLPGLLKNLIEYFIILGYKIK